MKNSNDHGVTKGLMTFNPENRLKSRSPVMISETPCSMQRATI